MRLRFAAAAALMCLAAPLTAAAQGTLPPGITAQKQGHGWLFGDDKGMTLYTYDRDEGAPGKSTCNDDCALTWPPLVAPTDAKPAGDWSVVIRDDGTPQWAYKARPVYRYAQDAFPGATFGDGVGTVWRIAFRQIDTPAEIRIAQTVLGQVLTDTKGLTLYSSAAACIKDCLKSWQPLAAPALANAFGDWSVVVRPDGFRQWAYQGKALYRHRADVGPGEVSGHGVKGWSAVVLEPPPPLPPWATIQPSDAGELIANEQGLTVYAREVNPRNRRLMASRRPGCEGECLDPEWVPFIAAPDAKPIGSWALVDLGDGRKQWSYKGQKIYTNTQDKKPGDFKGIRFGGDRSWATIMRNGQPMQGVTVGG
jgi:predicted lipoprotein with Yx(FWY)xxD motif